MKPRMASRLLLEALENRLQPGSMITVQGFGWSLAGIVPLLNPQAWEAPRVEVSLLPQNSAPAPQTSAAVPPKATLEIAVASESTAPTEAAPPSSDRGSNNSPATVPEAEHYLWQNLEAMPQPGEPVPASSLSLAALVPSATQQPALPAGSLPQSPTGVASPATPLASSPAKAPPIVGSPGLAPSGTGLRAVPVPIMPLQTGTVYSAAGYQTTRSIHAVPLALAGGPSHGGGNAGNQATLNFLSYLGGSGPAGLNSVAVQVENGTKFIYVAGFYTDTSGRSNAFAAKLVDGVTSAIWAMAITPTTPGPDEATGLALNGTSVYVAGSFADPTASSQSDGFVAELDATTGNMLSIGVLTGTSLAAVTTDPTGNVYAAGSVADPINAHQQDVALVKASNDLTTTIYDAVIQYQSLTGALANSSVTSGGGLIADGLGDVYFGGGIGLANDPNNDIEPLYGWFNDSLGPNLFASITVPNPAHGPRGMGTGVALDPNGNLVFTGSLNDDGSSTIIPGSPGRLSQDLVLGRVLPTLQPFVDPQGNLQYRPALEPVDALTWYVDDRTPAHARAGDWTGNQLAVLPDGSTIVTGAAYDPAALNNPPLSKPSAGIDVHMTHFLATDNATPTADLSDADPENIFGGSGTDVGMAVALDPTKTTNVYVVGNTSSTDLPTTAGVVQLTYGGGSSTGFVGQASVV